jgi:hypothetical protein
VHCRRAVAAGAGAPAESDEPAAGQPEEVLLDENKRKEDGKHSFYMVRVAAINPLDGCGINPPGLRYCYVIVGMCRVCLADMRGHVERWLTGAALPLLHCVQGRLTALG